MAELMVHLLILAEELERSGGAIMEMRRLRDLSNPFEMSSRNFYLEFGLPKGCVDYLSQCVRPRLARHRRNGLAVETQVLAALRFFSKGSYQKGVGDTNILPLSQTAVSRAINDVAQVICETIIHEWIKFPKSNENRQNVAQRFEEECNFKGVVGCIDNTHIAIARPHEHGDRFWNHQDFHSMNVQVLRSQQSFDPFNVLTYAKILCEYYNIEVSSQDLEILSINAQYPGSVHDSVIWKHSAAREKMRSLWELGDRTSWLLGGSNYPLEPWLMTPIADEEENTPARRYTEAHTRARNCVNKLFAVWKNTFQCLHNNRALRYQPVVCCRIIMACACLHNMKRHYIANNSDSDSDEGSDENNARVLHEPQKKKKDNARGEMNIGALEGERLNEAQQVRERIIRTNFSNVEVQRLELNHECEIVPPSPNLDAFF